MGNIAIYNIEQKNQYMFKKILSQSGYTTILQYPNIGHPPQKPWLNQGFTRKTGPIQWECLIMYGWGMGSL
jgi:hypothetical protein